MEEVYEIKDKVRVEVPEGAMRVDVWAPYLESTEYQRVLDARIEAPFPVAVGHDGEYGNAILHMAAPAEGLKVLDLEMTYRVRKRESALVLDPRKAGSYGGRMEAFHQYLRPERHVVVDGGTKELARKVVKREKNPLLQGRAIYEHVLKHMSYDAKKQSWVGSTEHALTCAIGNCNDIHALFISLARSLGMPARLVLGYALEPPAIAHDKEQCEVCGYHCWAEFYVPNLGWIPVDDSCAIKYHKKGLFGRLELNHVAFSRGRDVLLTPPQKGERLPFFASAYAEVDGMRQKVERKLSYRLLEGGP